MLLYCWTGLHPLLHLSSRHWNLSLLLNILCLNLPIYLPSLYLILLHRLILLHNLHWMYHILQEQVLLKMTMQTIMLRICPLKDIQILNNLHLFTPLPIPWTILIPSMLLLSANSLLFPLCYITAHLHRLPPPYMLRPYLMLLLPTRYLQRLLVPFVFLLPLWLIILLPIFFSFFLFVSLN